MNKTILFSTTTIILLVWLAIVPSSAAADNNSCQVVRYGFALNSDLQELKIVLLVN